MQGSTTPMRALRTGKMVPLFSLPSTAGGTHGPGALRSKYNLVLSFVGSGSPAESYLLALANLYPDLLSEQARVIAVVGGDLRYAQSLVERLSLPFPLLADSDGHLTSRMLGEGNHAALCVADRFGEVVYLQPAPGAAALPAPHTTLDWLEYIGLQCPE